MTDLREDIKFIILYFPFAKNNLHQIFECNIVKPMGSIKFRNYLINENECILESKSVLYQIK